MNTRLKETIFVAGVFIATLIAVCTYPFVREASAQAPPIKRNYFTTNQDPTITNIATNTFVFAVTNLVITNVDGSYFVFDLGTDSCLVWHSTNGVAYRICLTGGGSEMFIGQIGPVLVNAARFRLLSNGVSQVQSVPGNGNKSNVAFRVIGPTIEGSPIWLQVSTNSGYTGTGANVLTDDGTYKPATNIATATYNTIFATNLTVVSNFFSILNSHLNNTFITNLTAVSNFYAIANSYFNSIFVTNTFNILSNQFVFNNTTITNINQRPTVATNVSGTVDNFISLHSSSEVQVTMTNTLTTGSSVTHTWTLTNLTKNASCSISFYAPQAPSTNFVKFQVPSGSAIRWLGTTNGSYDFQVSSNLYAMAAFWCDRETNVFGCWRQSQ